MSKQPVTASAPAKAILLGEHGVNREQPALAVAVAERVRCTAEPRDDGRYGVRSGARSAGGERHELAELVAHVDALRERRDYDAIRALADDFFVPVRYVLGQVLERTGLDGVDVRIESSVRIGSGLGSGSAVACALAVSVSAAAGVALGPAEVAALAWSGDAVAHGGIASALDASACAHGGVVRYTLAGAATRVVPGRPLPLVVGDTLVTANTAEVNTRVRRSLEAHPARAHLFPEIGLLVEEAVAALEAGDLPRLGRLMNLNQLVLEKLGVSSPELDRLVEAALAAGALGAKLSGSGGGGIVVALAPSEAAAAGVAQAIERAGGRGSVVGDAAEGARIEEAPVGAVDRATTGGRTR